MTADQANHPAPPPANGSGHGAGPPEPFPEILDGRTIVELVAGVSLGVCTTDRDGRITFCSRTLADILAFPPTVIGQLFTKLVRARAPGLCDAEQVARRTGRSIRLKRLELTVPAGPRPRVLDVGVIPLRGKDGAVDGALVLVLDATDRDEVAERMALFYHAYLDCTDAIEITDRDGVIIDVNPAFSRIYGYSRAEAIGRNPNIVRSPKTPADVYREMWRRLKDPAIGSWSGEMTNLDKWGRDHEVLLTINALRDPGGAITHYLGIAVDTTEQRRLERGLARAERLTGLGQLAAGVAHELNTPLNNILLTAESLLKRAPDPASRGKLQTILVQVDVASRIVTGLLDFSRKKEPTFGRFDLVETMREVLQFIQGKTPKGVETVLSCPDEGLEIDGDRDQMGQVVSNILLNAMEAMEGKGRIDVRIARVPSTGVTGEQAVITIDDSGPGIPPGILDRIFEPFFTTKTDRGGTGLGLSVAYGIIKAHRGRIEASNRPDGGARFEVSLPIAQEKSGGPDA